MKILITLFLFVTLSLSAQLDRDNDKYQPKKDSSQNEESKDEPKKEDPTIRTIDKHKLIVRGGFGFSSVKIPQADEDKKAAQLDTALTNAFGGSGYFSTSNVDKDTGLHLLGGIEYRFLDKFRFLYDVRNLNTSSDASRNSGQPPIFFIQKGQYDWTEKTSKVGFAFFQPVTKYFNLGLMLRNYNIKQTAELSLNPPPEILSTFLTSRSSLGFAFLGTTKDSSFAKMNGLVPAFAIEFFPVNFLEFRYMLETVNLKGTQNSNGSDLLVVLLRGGGQFAGGVVGGINTTTSSFTYKGTINTFELGFKPRGDAAKFLFLKLGMSQEIYQKQYDKYFAFDSFGALGGSILQSGFNPIAQFINSTIYTSYVNSEVVVQNLYGVIEFRKGFN